MSQITLKIDSPYNKEKEYPYRASLHNHSQFTPAYTHPPVPSDERLKEFRDCEVDPLFGIVAISEHNRVSTPWNTNPPADRGVYDYSLEDPPWGVDGILWIPGNEAVIGSRDGKWGQIFGEIVVTGTSTEVVDSFDWNIVEEKENAKSGLSYSTNTTPASVELTFRGIGIDWYAEQKSDGGICDIYLDGIKTGEVDLYSPSTQLGAKVLSISDLTDEEHTIRFVRTDRKHPDCTARYSPDITMDTIVVHKKGGGVVEYGADHPELVYMPKNGRHAPSALSRSPQEILKLFVEDGCLVSLSNPNSRFETEGEHAGEQIWTSSGFTYDELDIIYGDEDREPYPTVPQAIEIGNYGYDLHGGDRTAYTNAEDKWDYILMKGHRLMGIATDDNHGSMRLGGWCVVYTNAPTREELEQQDVMESLLAGNFYASQGPGISNIAVNNGDFYLETDQPSRIEFISQGQVIQSEDQVYSSHYSIQGNEGYVRARVERSDPEWISYPIWGRTRRAWTNPVYVE